MFTNSIFKLGMFMIPFLAFTYISTANAYKLNIKNYYNGELRIKAKFGGPGFCGRMKKHVKPKANKKINVRGCCLISLKIRPTTGPLAKVIRYKNHHPKKYYEIKWRPHKRTGYGLSCQTNTVKVRQSGNQLIATDS